MYYFNQHFEQCKGFFGEKLKNSNLKKSIDFREELNDNLSEAYLEVSRKSMVELFCENI